MKKIIAANDPTFNSHSSESTLTTTNLIFRLPKLEYNLLCVAYEDYQATGYSERSSIELGKRFNKHPVTIRKAWKSLRERKLISSEYMRGKKITKLWITLLGFSWLDNQTLHQTLHEKLPIPYYNLFSEEEMINSKILKEEQICAQVALSPQNTLDERLDTILQSQRIAIKDKIFITDAIKRSRINQEAKKELTSRLAWVMNKNSIENKRAYFLRALQNEERFYARY